MQNDIVGFIRDVISHWGALLTGGVLVAMIWIWEHYKGTAIPVRLVIAIAAGALVVSTFMAWREQHQALLLEQQYRSRRADEFARLRHAAQKRYYEWWENCHNREVSDRARQAAELMRVEIVEKLKREISEAEADYFNTPRMFEPFPANRNLINCPDAVHINEFGYRIQRLSDVIQRILPPRGRA